MNFYINRFINSFELKDIKNLFKFDIIAENNSKELFLSIFIKRSILFYSIYELPIEINRIIMSYLTTNIKLNLIMTPSKNLPFYPIKWKLQSCFPKYKNIIKCVEYAIMRENSQFINNWSPVYNATQLTMLMLMRIQHDLKGILAFDVVLKHLEKERKIQKLNYKSKPFPFFYLQTKQNVILSNNRIV